MSTLNTYSDIDWSSMTGIDEFIVKNKKINGSLVAFYDADSKLTPESEF